MGHFGKDATFAGRPVVDFDYHQPLPDDMADKLCLHVSCTFDDQGNFPPAPPEMPRGTELHEHMFGMMDWFTRQPVATQLQALSIGMFGDAEASQELHGKTMIAAAANFPALRHLFTGNIGQNVQEAFWLDSHDPGAILAAYPALETLKIRASKWDMPALAPTRHDQLKTLIIEGCATPAMLFKWLGESAFPALEMLEVWTGNPEYGGIDDANPIWHVLMSEAMPMLTHLGLRNCGFGDQLVGELTMAPLVKQLNVLDLSRSTITDAGVETMLRYKADLAHLTRIDLSENFISPDAAAQLRAGLPQVVLDNQRALQNGDDGPEPFLWIGE